MRRAMTRNTSGAFLRRIYEFWPFLLVAVSVVGLVYIAMNAHQLGISLTHASSRPDVPESGINCSKAKNGDTMRAKVPMLPAEGHHD